MAATAFFGSENTRDFCIKWPDGKVYFYFNDNVNKDLRGNIKSAMKKIESTQLIKFIEIKSTVNIKYYLEITSIDLGNFSDLGVSKSHNQLNLNSGFLALHELCHVVGLIHEQCRSDRDYYIEVCYENIYDGINNHNFNKTHNSQNLTMYDFNSVMHYPAPAKGWQSTDDHKEMRTMINKINFNSKLGSKKWENLTRLDYIGLRKIYLFKSEIYSIKNISNNSFRNDHATKMQADYERSICDFEFEFHDEKFFAIRNMNNNSYLDDTITSMKDRVSGNGQLWYFENRQDIVLGVFKAYIKNKKNGKYLTKRASQLADHAKSDELHILTTKRINFTKMNIEQQIELDAV